MFTTPSSPAFAPAVVIDHVYPSLGAENFLVKRVVNEELEVFADIFKDGHDVVFAMLKWRVQGGVLWTEVPMEALENDRWKGVCRFEKAGRWEVVIEAWQDTWRAWKKHFKAKFDVHDEEIAIEAREGARLLEEASQRAVGVGALDQAKEIGEVAKMLRVLPAGEMMEVVLSEELQVLLDGFHDRSLGAVWGPLRVSVERERARFSSWYEFFPRSAEGIEGKHSTFRDCLSRLDDVREMGFDVIYLPPIHPIGITHRKGKNNTLTAGADDVGSPWAIGGPAGGHRAVEPALGTVEDLEWLVGEAKKRGMEIALDFAINCSPDHPYVKDHPDWFHQREDGSIRYAENPPKKYQDIYPINFHCADWKALWRELIDVVLFWVERGVKIFRVDNPHTKPVAFWEVLIAEVQAKDAEVLFLAEAFTKPRMMQVLGKVGFSQSYTYFTWRETKHELREYAEELTKGEMRWYYRANFWPNTPDILPHHLQHAGAGMFRLRAALAATLMPSWGIYSGYELCENEPLPGREEYLDSEKYQLKARDWNAAGNIKGFIAALNRLRREHEALQFYDNLTFHEADHPDMMVYSKKTADASSRVLVVINLSVEQTAAGMVRLDLAALGLGQHARYRVEDLLHGSVYEWQGEHNYVSLDPKGVFMHLFKVVE